MHRHHKPVRKCHGCGLNLRDRCGVFENPREKWVHGHCPGHKNAEMLADYERREADRALTKHDRHRDAQRLKATEPHYQGRRDPKNDPPHEHPDNPTRRR